MTPTARARIEQAVVDAKTGYQWNGRLKRSQINMNEIAVNLILAERARLKRGVKKQQQDAIAVSNDSKWWDGYIAATKDILSLWEK